MTHTNDDNPKLKLTGHPDAGQPDINHEIEAETEVEERLAHAMLQRYFEDDRNRNDAQRIDRVIQAIESQKKVQFWQTKQFQSRLRTFSQRALSAAAIVLIFAGISFMMNDTQSAMALEDIIKKMRTGDRTFLIEVQKSASSSDAATDLAPMDRDAIKQQMPPHVRRMMEHMPPHKQEMLVNRFQFARKQLNPANKLDGATLHLSDNKYVISYAKGSHVKGPKARHHDAGERPNFVRGFDGSTHWMIYPNHPHCRKGNRDHKGHKGDRDGQMRDGKQDQQHGPKLRGDRDAHKRGKPGDKFGGKFGARANGGQFNAQQPALTPEQAQLLQQFQQLAPMERKAFMQNNPQLRDIMRERVKGKFRERMGKPRNKRPDDAGELAGKHGDYRIRQSESSPTNGPFRSGSMNDVAKLLLIDLRDMLSQIEINYDVTEPVKVESKGQVFFQYTAKRKDDLEDTGVSTFSRKRISSYNSEEIPVLSAQGSPETIIITVDPAQYQIQAITCKGLRIGPMSREKYDLSFIKLEGQTFSENWFTPEAHIPTEEKGDAKKEEAVKITA